MSFTPGIPQPGQSLGNSRTQVLNNMAILRTTIATNHTDVNLAGNGKHTFVQWVAQGADPVTGANEVAEYTKVVGGLAKKFLAMPGGGTIFQTYNGVAPTVGANGSTYLPGGLVFKWGVIAAPVSGDNPVAFGTAFPVNCFNVQVSLERASANVDGVTIKTGSISVNGFIADAPTNGSANIYWNALGN